MREALSEIENTYCKQIALSFRRKVKRKLFALLGVRLKSPPRVSGQIGSLPQRNVRGSVSFYFFIRGREDGVEILYAIVTTMMIHFLGLMIKLSHRWSGYVLASISNWQINYPSRSKRTG